LDVDGKVFTAVRVELPKTNLLVISNDVGYIMCAALDVDVFDANEKLREREVIAGRASGVRTINDLLHAPLQKVTNRSEEHTSELQSRFDLVCRLLLEKKKK